MSTNDFADDPAYEDSMNYLAGEQHKTVETMVYLARHQGLRAGVRPNTQPPEPGDENFPPIKRVVFFEFPEKTIEWQIGETAANTPWLDSLPQYVSEPRANTER